MGAVAVSQVPRPGIPTWAAGSLYQTLLNRHPQHLLYLYTQTLGGFRVQKPFCVARTDSSVSIPSGSDTVVQFAPGASDTDTMWASVTATQITIQTPGWYRCTLQVHWPNNGVGQRACKIMANGTNPVINAIAADCRSAGAGAEGDVLGCERLYHFSTGASVFANVWQSSGSSLALTSNYSGTFLAVEFVAP